MSRYVNISDVFKVIGNRKDANSICLKNASKRMIENRDKPITFEEIHSEKRYFEKLIFEDDIIYDLIAGVPSIDLADHDKQIRDEVVEGYKWISVKDKMPSDCGEDWVLVLPYDGDYRCIPTVAEYRKGHWWGHTLCTEDDCIDGEDSPFEIKYWKPIYDEFQMEYLEQMKGE